MTEERSRGETGKIQGSVHEGAPAYKDSRMMTCQNVQNVQTVNIQESSFWSYVGFWVSK